MYNMENLLDITLDLLSIDNTRTEGGRVHISVFFIFFDVYCESKGTH